MPTTTRHHSHHTRGGHVRALRENQTEQGVRQPLTAALISGTQPQERVGRMLAPITTISTEPLIWAISCILPFSTDQHYTPHGQPGHFMALFIQGCLSFHPLCFSREKFTNIPTFWIDKSPADAD